MKVSLLVSHRHRIYHGALAACVPHMTTPLYLHPQKHTLAAKHIYIYVSIYALEARTPFEVHH